MRGKWWTLVGACFGLFILMLDSTVVALALPEIRGDVGASAEGLQWVMNGYLLTIAVSSSPPAGSATCSVASASSSSAWSSSRSARSSPAPPATSNVLILGRVLQGVGAAPVLPLSLALVVNVFPRQSSRGRWGSGRRSRRSPWRSGRSPAAS